MRSKCSRRTSVARSACADGLNSSFFNRSSMNASTGVRAQPRSAAAVNFGISGCDRWTKAQCRRSTGVYLPNGAIASDAASSEMTETPNASRFMINHYSTSALVAQSGLAANRAARVSERFTRGAKLSRRAKKQRFSSTGILTCVPEFVHIAGLVEEGGQADSPILFGFRKRKSCLNLWGGPPRTWALKKARLDCPGTSTGQASYLQLP